MLLLLIILLIFLLFFNFFFDIQFSSEVSVVSFFLRNVLLVIRLVHFFFGAFSISLWSIWRTRVRAFGACVYSLLLIFNPIPLPVPIIVWHTRTIVHYAYVNWFWSDADIVINNRWHTCIVYVLQCTGHSTMYMRFSLHLSLVKIGRAAS